MREERLTRSGIRTGKGLPRRKLAKVRGERGLSRFEPMVEKKGGHKTDPLDSQNHLQ